MLFIAKVCQGDLVVVQEDAAILVLTNALPAVTAIGILGSALFRTECLALTTICVLTTAPKAVSARTRLSTQNTPMAHN